MPLFSFLARFAALFSIKVLSGFFLLCFLLSVPLLMLNAPSALIGFAEAMPCRSIYAAQAPTPPHYIEQQFLNFFPLPH